MELDKIKLEILQIFTKLKKNYKELKWNLLIFEVVKEISWYITWQTFYIKKHTNNVKEKKIKIKKNKKIWLGIFI